VERKQLPADWRRRLQVIQASAADAAAALPADSRDAVGGRDAPLDYAAVRAARDRLAQGAERSFFGGLAGPAGVWDKLVRAYERDSAAPLLHPWAGQAAAWPTGPEHAVKYQHVQGSLSFCEPAGQSRTLWKGLAACVQPLAPVTVASGNHGAVCLAPAVLAAGATGRACIACACRPQFVGCHCPTSITTAC